MSKNSGFPAGLKQVAFLLLAACLMLIPLFYNGTPLYYPDSMGYIFWGQLWQPVPERASTYAVLIRGLSLGRDLWFVILAQALLAAWILQRLWNRIQGQNARMGLLVSLFLLGLLSPLGWTASTLMPDLYCALSSLFLYVLLFPEKDKKPSIMDLAGFVFCSAQHLSGLVINGLLLISLMALLVLQKQIREAIPGIRMAMIGLFLAYGCLGAINWMLSGEFYLSKSGPAFLTARIIETGIGNRYLNQHPEACADFQKVKKQFPMPAEYFLWNSGSPMATLGGIKDASGKMAEFNRNVLSSPSNLLLFLKAGFKSGLKQLFQTDLGDGLSPTTQSQLFYYPENQAESLLSKQNGGIAFEKLNGWCLALLAGLLLNFVLFVLPGGLRPELRQQLIFIVLLLILNAFVNGALSTPLNRYQVRVFWLVDFWLLAAAYPAYLKHIQIFRNRTA